MKLAMNGRRAAWGGSLAAVLALAIAVPSLSLAGTSGKAAKQSIVWLELGSGNPYWDAQHQAADAYLTSLGYSFKSVSGQGKPESQSATLRQLADQGVNVVMLNPVDPKALVPAVKYAEGKGTKVVSVYASMPSANTSVVFDEIRSGRVAAQYALNELKQRYGKVSGKVAVLVGIFLNEVGKGRLYATELYSPYWTGYAFSKFAVDLAKGQKVKKLNMVDSMLVTPKNASCVTKMATDMQTKLKTFPFVGSLQTIARTK